MNPMTHAITHASAAADASADTPPDSWILRLYVAGQTPRSLRAVASIEKICANQLQGRYRLEVIDLYQQPQLAQGEQIVAVPALIKRLPDPLRMVIGDMSNAERVLVGLDLLPKQVLADEP
jgi:circadian clock protein KaiB